MPRRRTKIQENFPHEATDIVKFEDIHAVINYVQMSRKECSFIVDANDSITMEHLFNDCQILYDSKKKPKGIQYHLMPSPVAQVPEEVFSIDEDYDDEILEEGQCF